ncbi:hypothetical protein M8J77_016654 [Diaphorina citri]|nr:hypothetical protein M8J77_016654 [Diaphorina citri]
MFWHLQLAHQVTNVEFDSYDEKVRGIAHSVVTSQRIRQQRKLESLLNSKRLNTRTHSIDRQFEKRFINLSDVTFEEKEQTLLNKGMKYATSPKFDDNLVNNVVVSIQSRIPAMRMTDRHTLLHQVSVNVNKEERCNGKQRNRDVRIMKSIRLKLANNNLIMTKADKSSTIVVLEQQEYNNKVLEFINKDPLIRPLANNPTNRCQSNIGCFLKSMKELTPNPKLLKVINPIAPRLYGNLKIHKVQRTNAKEAPIRPVVSAVTSPTYLLEKFLVKTIKRALPNFKSQYSVKNSKELIDKIKNMQVPERGNLISLDVKNLFPNVKIAKVIDIISDTLNNEANLSAAEIREIIEGLKTVHANNYFQFNNTCYQQEDGCPMGSPLSPLLSEFYMYEFEKEIFKLPSNLVDNIKYLHRYVDDILILWLGTRRQLDTLLGKINQIWDGFSLELEYGGKTIDFLDLTVTIQENKHKFKIYRKESFADVIIPSNSYHSYHHKMAVFRNYYNRLLNTPLDLDEYREECRTIRAIGFNNGFTSQEMRKIFNSTRRHRMNQLVYSTKPVEPPSIYVKLPFISNLENRLLPTLNKYKCKPAFSSKTLTSLFARKDTIPHEDQSGVYRLTCECGSTYVGMTQRSLKTRLNEHKAAARNNKPEKSNFAKHVLETGHNMNAAKQEILWCGKNFREILYHEQIEIHKAVHSGQCVNEIVETVPNLVYKRDQLISHQVTVSTPPPLSLSATTTTPTLSFP